jgi:hypothetical protein
MELRGFDPQLTNASIAQRMHWAAGRETTRPEDEAYSLLGIFDVNLPLIYGEGRKAFIRLQEEIIRRTTDQSIFAWRLPILSSHRGFGLLASSPRMFADSGNVVAPSDNFSLERPFAVTNNGVEFVAKVYADEADSALKRARDLDVWILKLNCKILLDGDERRPVYISLGSVASTKSNFVRVSCHDLGQKYHSKALQSKGEQRFYVAAFLDPPFLIPPRQSFSPGASSMNLAREYHSSNQH